MILIKMILVLYVIKKNFWIYTVLVSIIASPFIMKITNFSLIDIATIMIY